jgi:hypothetical protein
VTEELLSVSLCVFVAASQVKKTTLVHNQWFIIAPTMLGRIKHCVIICVELLTEFNLNKLQFASEIEQ